METEIQYIKIPEAFTAFAGVRDRGKRIYRREGNHEEMVQWFDALTEHIGGCVSTGGAAVYAGVTRAGVHKRLKVGKLTAFCFYITEEKQTLFGGKKKLKHGALVYIPVSECQAWRKELEERVARIEATNALTPEDREALDEASGDGEDENPEFLENDPKDTGKKGVRRQRS